MKPRLMRSLAAAFLSSPSTERDSSRGPPAASAAARWTNSRRLSPFLALFMVDALGPWDAVPGTVWKRKRDAADRIPCHGASATARLVFSGQRERLTRPDSR